MRRARTSYSSSKIHRISMNRLTVAPTARLSSTRHGIRKQEKMAKQKKLNEIHSELFLLHRTMKLVPSMDHKEEKKPREN